LAEIAPAKSVAIVATEARTSLPRRPGWIALLVFAIAFLVYGSNSGYLYSYDSAPNSLLVFNALEHRTLAFDDFRDDYLFDLGAGYVFATTPSGHLEPIFPIGTALLTAPIYLVEYAVARAKAPFPDITAVSFEPIRLRDEKRAANVVAALAAALFFLCALRIAGLPGAFFGTVAFAFGSEMWSVGSQALWQHGSIALVTLAMIAALLSLRTARSNVLPLIVAGLFAGFLTVIRPTAAVFSLAGFAVAADRTKSRCWIFLCAAIVGALPGVFWNVLVFQSFLGGYAVNLGSYTFTFSQAVAASTGLLVSPSRGLFVFAPFVVLSVFGAVRASRQTSGEARMLQYLTLASVATFANYAFFQRWEGGATFGPRYLTELMPTAALLAAFVFPRRLPRLNARRVCVTVAVLVLLWWSVGVQLVGANGDPKTNWSGIPLDISDHPERVWDWSDSQIVRDARATYHLVVPNPTFRTAYALGFGGTIDSVSGDGFSFDTSARNAVSPGAMMSLSALVTNLGSSRWYGYASGLYFGQAHVRVRVVDGAGNVVLERYLYFRDDAVTGTVSRAAGIVDAPRRPGRYQAEFDIDVNQNARIGSRRVGMRSATFRVK
jgi:hypothetical protein